MRQLLLWLPTCDAVSLLTLFSLCCFIVSVKAFQQGMQSSAAIGSVSMGTPSREEWGSELRSRRRVPAERHVGLTRNNGRKRVGCFPDPLPPLSRCLAVSLCLSASSRPSHSLSRLPHRHRPGTTWTVSEKAESIMKTKTGCRGEEICP